MNAKILTIMVGILMLVPAGYAADRKFGDCPDGYDCEEIPSDGQVFPPNAVTAHTVYASFVIERVQNQTFGLPTDFAAIAGYFAEIQNATFAKQRECVVWFNGYNLDQRPDPDSFGWGAENAFPSDEDQPAGAAPNHDASFQDYDFDRDVENCLPVFDIANTTLPPPAYAVVVEAGDCDPSSGTAHRFRGHLDFVDPNDIYHEVQEYDYECGWLGPGGLGASAVSNIAFQEPEGGQWLSSGGLVPDFFGVGNAVQDFFPATGTDVNNNDGCQIYESPADNQDIVGSQDPGSFDLGHKCNGSVNDLFTERMWITPVHATEIDPTILQPYNFALQIDTCAGMNIYEGIPVTSAVIGAADKDAEGAGTPWGARTNPDDSEVDPQSGGAGNGKVLDTYHALAYHNYYGVGLDTLLAGYPLYDVCTDGSSFSFDDTPRGRTVHSGPPPGLGSTEIMRGNSYDFDAGSETVGTHRTNCRHNYIDWPYSTYPPGVGDDCYPEDHKDAQIDIYVYDADPTGGLFVLNSNGLTGPAVYGGPGIANGPNEFPPYGP